MSTDSIDVLNKIQIEIEYTPESFGERMSYDIKPDYYEATVDVIRYEGVKITGLLPMFTDEELIANDTLETEKSLQTIKQLAK